MDSLSKPDRCEKMINNENCVTFTGDTKDVDRSIKCSFFGSGRFFILLLFVSLAGIGGSVFASLNFAWICMTTGDNHEISQNSTDPYFMRYTWGRSEQKTIFAAYNFGTFISQLPIGVLVKTYGPKYVYFGCILLSLIVNAFIPTFAEFGYLYVAGLRAIAGGCVNSLIPVIFGILCQWIPDDEMGFSLGILMTGPALGQVLTLPFSGLECATIGWPFAFYIPTAVGSLFLILWMVFFTNSPTENRFISNEEKFYITINKPTRRCLSKVNNYKGIPWIKIITSPAVIACVTSNAGYCFCVNMILQFTPTYLHEVIGMSVVHNGLYSALPIVAQVLFRNIFGYLSDLSLWSSMRTLQLRLFNSVAFFGSAVALFSITMMEIPRGDMIPEICLIICLALMTISFGGFLKSPILIAPAYSPILSAMMMTCGNIAAVCMAYVVGYLTPDGTSEQWNDVFYVVSGVLCGTGVIFLAFGQSRVQDDLAKEE